MKYDIGSVIGAYRLQACCGEGTYGTVFLAVHEKIGQQVALKLLHNTSESKRAQRELAGLQAVLQHCRLPFRPLLVRHGYCKLEWRQLLQKSMDMT